MYELITNRQIVIGLKKIDPHEPLEWAVVDTLYTKGQGIKTGTRGRRGVRQMGHEFYTSEQLVALA
jgi:hypothetical protein